MKKPKFNVEYVGIDEVSKAHYNPRERIEERFQDVIRSLRHLGFLMPLFVNQEGVLLSGHQRIDAARELGYTKIPILALKMGNDSREKSVNLLFNQITNDFGMHKEVEELHFERTWDEAKLPVVEPDDFSRLKSVKWVDPRNIDVANDSVSVYERSRVSGAVHTGVIMPLIMCGGEVVNGKLRYWGFLNRHMLVPVIKIPKELRDFADFSMNGLAMRFTVQEEYADLLRSNAYRRRGVDSNVFGVSRSYAMAAWGEFIQVGTRRDVDKKAEGSVMADERADPNSSSEIAARYRKAFGNCFVDFGAGMFNDAEKFREAGFKVMAFEPFCIREDGTKPDREYSREMALKFLSELKCTAPESIVSSCVLNSVPYHRDRMAVLAIIAALGGMKCPVYIGTQSVQHAERPVFAKVHAEPNMRISTGAADMKVQKYFRVDELEKMLRVFWIKVEIKKYDKTLLAICRNAKRVSPDLLADALKLEFNLPFVDGATLDLVNEAFEAFEARTGLTLPR